MQRPVAGAIVDAPAVRGRRVDTGQAGEARADGGLLALLEDALGTRTTPANRKNSRPSVRNRSPSDATFCTTGSGIGMMSPRIRRWTRKSSAVPGRTMCSAESTSAAVKPAATRLVSQIGM